MGGSFDMKVKLETSFRHLPFETAHFLCSKLNAM